jgi:hypothetical protein
LIKNVLYLSLGPLLKDGSKFQETLQALKREHPALQNMNFFTFFFFASLFSYWIWIWICIPNVDLDPDTADQNQCGSGSTTLEKEMVENNQEKITQVCLPMCPQQLQAMCVIPHSYPV